MGGFSGREKKRWWRHLQKRQRIGLVGAYSFSMPASSSIIYWLALLLCALLWTPPAHADAVEFYSQRGTDVTFEEVMASGDLPRGENSRKGFEGSRLRINHELLEGGPNSNRSLLEEIRIHTLGHSAIQRPEFDNWSRWYQEDKNTQIFRLFEGEESVRNSRKLAARIEAFSEFSWVEGDWQEWVGTYTIIKPHRCAIFQAKSPTKDWSVQLNINDKGDVTLNHRRGEDKVMGRNMVGKPFHIRVRDNGLDYEVYFNGKKEGEGSWPRPNERSSFRWGMYLGAREVTHDAMLLVTGAAVNPKDRPEVVVESSPPKVEPVEKEEPGLQIPSRVWTNQKGETVRAEARFVIEEKLLKLRIDDKWIPYPMDELADSDHRELVKLIEAMQP